MQVSVLFIYEANAIKQMALQSLKIQYKFVMLIPTWWDQGILLPQNNFEIFNFHFFCYNKPHGFSILTVFYFEVKPIKPWESYDCD